MLKLLVVALLVIGKSTSLYVKNETELVFTLLVHRHGDRTPVEDTLSMTTDVEAVEAASKPFGYGQLTDLGKERSYALGKYIRHRYNDLLSPQYNRSDIYIRSTDSTRTKMSVLAAMAAVYPAYEGSWSKDINWVPVPYTTVPIKYDFNSALTNCPVYMDAFYATIFSNPYRMVNYSDVMSVLATVYGTEYFKNMPVLAYAIFDAIASQQSLGVPVDERIVAILPKLKQAADEAIDLLLGDDNYISLQAGVLLNEFFTYASQIINGEDTPRLRVYSAHDFNVYSLMAVSQITPRQGVPAYSSAFSLELRKYKDGQYVVLAVYQPSPGEDLIYLPIKGCSSLDCDINEFYTLVSKYTLDEDTWRTQCGFTEDLEIDDSSVA